ncbi:quinoprotein glucose dehydrogenase [Catalinimonas alkaloidigena]|uniref:Quinoprotein glucose dehydrogenase n=1 Tax=Catalinimonas alkaloidigena TaxID=1075417 RepID=A0A1G9HBS9_9BACT|nr:pyrroloquinoline quinone-dependent dehydrogenase [Catalinimonas alkaloidigena]SDL10478.1 quinoprotein glucose dehydrogenase [Catalinimonas alkaloidigena]
MHKLLLGGSLLFLLAACQPPQLRTERLPDPYRTWQVAGGDQGATRYSALTQLNQDNVAQLEVAWTYRTGDAREKNRSTIECNPIVVEGVLYATSPRLKVVALDAATGQERWRFDPFGGKDDPEWASIKGANRGVTYWQEGDERRILFTAGPTLFALDAATGQLVESFGKGGKVDLREGLDRDTAHVDVWASSPGGVYQNLYILGPSVNDHSIDRVPGHVRAYDVRTGTIAWTFHTIPQPGEPGYETWPPDAWQQVGGVNAWSGLTLDPETGIVYLATGSPAADFYGADRRGNNLYGNSVLALNASDGSYVWHYQVVHHDLWDRDLPCPPMLIDVEKDGNPIAAVAQLTKQGFVFVLDRATGQPLWQVEERPVPPSRMPGEWASATQPYPTHPEPFVRQGFADSLVTDLSPEAHAAVAKRLEKLRYGHLFLPADTQATVVFPGLVGGSNWSGGAYDPETGWLYVNANEVPYLLQLVPEERPDATLDYRFTGHNRFLDPEGYPAVKPPWGTLNAIDLKSGKIVWKVPLGEFETLTQRGVPPTGTLNLGGSLVTAGGLVFIGSTMDERFRAFDKQTGKVLWEAKLPAGGYAAPATYEVNGRQYVVIAAGGGGNPQTPSGDAYVAFALPE